MVCGLKNILVVWSGAVYDDFDEEAFDDDELDFHKY
jgi:hypothetical protein